MARLRYMSNARTGTAGTVCEGNLLINGDIKVTGSYAYGSGSVPLDQTLGGTLTVGTSGAGKDVLFHGGSATYQWFWDSSVKGVIMKGTWTCVGNINITGTVAQKGDVTMWENDQINFYTGGGATIKASAQNTLALYAATEITLDATTITLTGAIALVGALTSTKAITISPDTTATTYLEFVLGTEWLSGTLIEASYTGEASQVDGDVIGMLLDFNDDVTMTSNFAVTGYQVKTPGIDQSASHTTVIIGFDLPTAAGIDISGSGGSVTFKGLNVAMPDTDEAYGTVIAYGAYLHGGTISGSSEQTGLYIDGDITNGIDLAGVFTNFINFSDVGTTSTIALHFVDAHVGKIIETGTYGTAGTGVTLASGNYRPVSFLFDDAGGELTAQNYRGVLSRIYLSVDQGNQVSIRAMQGHIKLADTVDLTIGQSYFGCVNGVEGYIECAGATQMDVGANTRVAAVHGFVELRQDTVIASGGIVAGVFAELGMNSETISGAGDCAGVWIDVIDSDHGWTGVWPVGLKIATDAATIGIDVGACTTGIDITAATTAININGAGTNAIIITQTGSTSTIGTCLAIGVAATPITSLTTASMAVKVYSDYSKTSGYHMAMYVHTRYTADDGATGTVRGIVGVADFEGTQTTSSTEQYLVGVHGRAIVSGTVYNTQCCITGVHGQILDGGTYTAANHVSAIWADWHLDVTLSGITSTELLYLTNNSNSGTNDPANIIYIYGAGVGTFINFDGCETSGFISSSEATGSCKKAKCYIGDTAYYINMYELS